jgi:hypothetical protein
LIAGDLPVVFANEVSITTTSGGTRLQLGFLVPGESAARAVADVVVTPEILAKIKG